MVSAIFCLLLLIVQMAVCRQGQPWPGLLLATHAVVCLLSAAWWKRTTGTLVPDYSWQQVMTDGGNLGKVFSMEYDDVRIGAIVAGLFFGVPSTIRMYDEYQSVDQLSEYLMMSGLILLTPISVFLNWRILRSVLWWALPLCVLWFLWR